MLPLGPDDVVVHGGNEDVLPHLADSSFQLVYLDPPFNTGRRQRRRTVRTDSDEEGGDRLGFGGRRYRTTELTSMDFADDFDDYLGFLAPRLVEAHRVLADDGTLYFHIDYREAHYCKVLLDRIFGRECFLNEVIWAYDYGGRPRDRWPAKHDTILVYAKRPGCHVFEQDQVDRIPYLAPGLVSPEKRARGKLPTDVWWHTIVPTNGREKTGYPTQKPEGVLRRLMQASTRPGGWVLDLFAGSGTTGAVARQLQRRFVLVDHNPDAIEVMRSRLGTEGVAYLGIDQLRVPSEGTGRGQVGNGGAPPDPGRGGHGGAGGGEGAGYARPDMEPHDRNTIDAELTAPTIPAATVVLLRQGPGGVETLMVQRSSKLAFAGGMWVWPGGRIDDADRARAGSTGEGIDAAADERAARWAAVRETAEETDLALDPATLVWFSHWTTPPIAPKRFATYFFAAEAPGGDVAVDGGEILDHRWIAPAEALARRNAGEIELAPPTWTTLEHLVPFATVADALAVLGAGEPERFATQFLWIEGGGVALFHGDAAYDQDDPTIAGPRHRLWMLDSGWRYERDT